MLGGRLGSARRVGRGYSHPDTVAAEPDRAVFKCGLSNTELSVSSKLDVAELCPTGNSPMVERRVGIGGPSFSFIDAPPIIGFGLLLVPASNIKPGALLGRGLADLSRLRTTPSEGSTISVTVRSSGRDFCLIFGKVFCLSFQVVSTTSSLTLSPLVPSIAISLTATGCFDLDMLPVDRARLRPELDTLLYVMAMSLATDVRTSACCRCCWSSALYRRQ